MRWNKLVTPINEVGLKMASRLLASTPRENKKTAAKIVQKLLSDLGPAQIVSNADTGGGEAMLFGVHSETLGLVHVTTTKSTSVRGLIRGWQYKDLKDCERIDHVAFVWEDDDGRVLHMVLKRSSVLELAQKNNGQYSRDEIKKHAIKGPKKVIRVESLGL